MQESSNFFHPPFPPRGDATINGNAVLEKNQHQNDSAVWQNDIHAPS